MKRNRLLFLLPLIASFVLTSCDMLSNLNFGGPRKKSSQEDSEVWDDSDDYPIVSSKSSSKSSSSSSAHQHNWSEWTRVKEPTCTEQGKDERTCACGQKETRVLPALGHTYVEVPPENDTEVDPVHKARAATCTETGIKVEICTMCQYRKESYIPATGHTWGEWYADMAPTCTSSGVGRHECLVCGTTESQVIPATGHNWGEWEILTPATCTTTGVGKHVCTVCGAYEQRQLPATGHDYDENNVNWTSQPTCTEEGIGYVRCKLCSEQVMVTEPALGHSQTLLDYHAPQSGTADTRVYSCSRCGKASLNFSVDSATNESKRTLIDEWYGEDFGMRFWGRPIGNDVELNENGDADRDNHEPVFNPSQKGDFFEIIFNLTAQQAAVLGQCMLYCDAKPANYLGSNKTDFWARRDGDTDWTPGFYIDGDNYGQEIIGYRYMLYVDNQPVEFDSGIKAPVPTGDPRGEYVMPYVFNLHSGINKFSLHMAGGYRSTFFNFTFRTVSLNHTHTFGEWQSDDNYHWKECVSANCFAEEGTQYNKATHVWSEAVTSVSPTHSTAGVATKTCTVCGKTSDIVIPKLSHDWIESATFQNNDEVPKNCTAVTCSCGKAGVKMNANDYSSCVFGSDADQETDNLRPSQGKAIVYNIVVPQAANYSICLGMKCKTNGATLMSNRRFSVKINGVEATVTDWGKQTSNDLGLNGETVVLVELVPAVDLAEGIAEISITCSSYRLYYGGDLVIMEN